KDMDESAWYAPYVRYAKAQGVIQGYPDGTFRPTQAVNFAEALKMAYAALGVSGDASATGAWYESYLSHAKSNGVLFQNNVDVSTGMSRKDVVWIVWKLTQGTTTAQQSSSIVSSAKSSVSGSCTIKGNISTSGEKIYHLPGCSSYDKTTIDESTGEHWFCSEQEATAAGWRKARNCP
ncbi:MAG: S-layer homology domain-containing protein, partial [Candidatus Peribacteraceae bacterium]|nr:S-layer homology domain-containing protein [Candidatus Peribacteraceae bacterium]